MGMLGSMFYSSHNTCAFAVIQFSSIGSLDEKWMAELKSSMSSGLSPNKRPLGLGEPLIIWPTVEDVRCSLEVALNCLFFPYKLSCLSEA